MNMYTHPLIEAHHVTGGVHARILITCSSFFQAIDNDGSHSRSE